MKDEFNKNPSDEFNNTCVNEFSALSVREWGNFSENKSSAENLQASEYGIAKMQKSASSQKGKKKSGLVKKLISFAAAAVAVVSVATLVPPVEADAHFLELAATDASITYLIETHENDTDLVLVVSNPNTERIIDLVDGENEGEILGLVPNMEYVLSVRDKSGKKTTIKDRTVKTLSGMEEEFWYGIDYTPAINSKGEFKFTPYFYNKDNAWSEIVLVMIDKNEYMLEIPLTESGKEYNIDLKKHSFTSSDGFWYVYAVPSDSQNEEFIYLHESDLTIMKTVTAWQSLTYSFDESTYKFEFTPIFTDENGFWGKMTAQLYDDNLQRLDCVVGESGKSYVIDVPREGFLIETAFIEFVVEVTFNGEPIEVYIYGETLELFGQNT